MQHYLVIALPQYDDTDTEELTFDEVELSRWVMFNLTRTEVNKLQTLQMEKGDVFCYRGGWIICTNNLIR